MSVSGKKNMIASLFDVQSEKAGLGLVRSYNSKICRLVLCIGKGLGMGMRNKDKSRETVE